MNDLPRIAAAFADYFRCTNLNLPKSVLKRRKRGVIRKEGWLIQSCFGKDGKGESPDVYSSHRMSGDDHRRLREDGSAEQLPAMTEFMFYDEGDDMKTVEGTFHAENQAVAP